MNYFKRILLICQASITFIICIYFIWEGRIVNLARYLPNDDGKTIRYYHDLFRLGIAELLWLSVGIIIAIGLYSKPRLLHRLDTWERRAIAGRSFSSSVIFISSIIVIGVAFFVLQQFPNSSDEYVYVYQAQTLTNGKFFNDAPPVPGVFNFNHIAIKDGISVGRFPPGWPLVLSIFLFLGIPAALVNPLLAVATLMVFYRLALKIYDAQIATWAVTLLAFSSFFILNSASFFSHASCALEALLMVYFIHDYLQTGKLVKAMLAGIFLGLIFLTRYYTAFLLFIPMAIYLFHREGVKSFLVFVVIGIGTIPFIGFFLYYNHAITGDMLLPVTVWAYNDESLGFVNGHTFEKALEHIVRRLAMFMYSASPMLLFLYFFYLAKKVQRKSLAFAYPWDYFFVLLIIGYIFYYEIGGNQYGPRFYYEAYPFLILFVLHEVFRRRAYWAKVLLYSALIVMVVKVPLIMHREHKVIHERMDVYEKVRIAHIRHAVVILKSGTAVIRPMPGGDLTRNDAKFEADVLYTVDHPDFTDDLLRYYSDRTVYEYIRTPGDQEGRLIRIR